jgi:hypothetical protein
MIYMTRIQNMSFFLFKVNNPFVRHPVWPCWAPYLAPSGPPSGPIGHPVSPRRAPFLAFVGHPVWPTLDTPSGPSPAPVQPLSGTLSGPIESKKIKYIYIFFGCCCRLEKRGKNISVFGFQSPRSPRSPSSAGFAGEATRRRRFFRPSSPSHPSKLYSSLGWLNSKVPKPFFPFTLRLIDVDGF